MMRTSRKLAAEFIGTFMLVSAICGCSMIGAGAPESGSGILRVALGVGMSVSAAAYAFGPISGGHFNPAVTLGVWAAGRFSARDILPYIAIQVIGGAAAAIVFYIILSSQAGWTPGGFTSNGYGAHSPGGFSVSAAFLTETVQTGILVLIVVTLTRPQTPAALAPLAIGLTYAAMHLMSIPVANTSLNPARSTATALFAEGWALQQLWLFWVAPVAGGLAGGALGRWLGATGAGIRRTTR